jgi:hypothetical protein
MLNSKMAFKNELLQHSQFKKRAIFQLTGTGISFSITTA